MVVAALAAVTGVAIQLIGVQRVRRALWLEEPEPYFVASQIGSDFENDPVVGPLVKAEREAGNKVEWQLAHLAPRKESEGYEYLRTDHRRIVFRSRTLAHAEENILMVKRGS